MTSNSLVWYFSTGLIGFLTKGHGRNGWCCVSFTWKIPYFTYRVINCCFIFTHKSFCHFKRFILRSLNSSHELTWTEENIGPWLTGFLHRFLWRQDTANLLPDFAKSARPVRASPGKVVGAAPNVGRQSCARCRSLRNTLPVSIHYENVKKTTQSFCNIATCFFMIAEFGNDARLPNRKFLAWKGCLCKKHGHNISLNTLFSWLCISSPCTHSLTNQLSKANESQKIKNTNLYLQTCENRSIWEDFLLVNHRRRALPFYLACFAGSFCPWPQVCTATARGSKMVVNNSETSYST